MSGRIASLPEVGSRRVAIRITKDAQRQVRAGHPWVFESSITSIGHNGECGDLAVVFDDKRRFLAIGLYDPSSPIRVRVLHRGSPRSIDPPFWAERLDEALDRRRSLAATPDTTAYRCVHGENDQLPGLVVDRYDRTFVIKLDTAAWLPHLEAISAALVDRLAPERLVLRASRSVGPALDAVGLIDGAVLVGEPPAGPIRFRENGLLFEADVVRGQKTGHFLDQRDNRARVGAVSSGRSVLDVFSCTGGFTVNAAAGGATAVHSVDASRHAIAAVADHLALNHDRPAVARCRAGATVGDAFEVMADLAADGRRFGIVVVDPPSFASKQADVSRALAAYERLSRLAVALTAPGGTLVQSSCSSRVPESRFFDAVGAGVAQGGRSLVELERTGHAIDHPVGFAQGAYLKTLFATVE